MTAGGAVRVALHGSGVAVTAGGAVRVGSGSPLPFQRLDDGGVAGRALQRRQPPHGGRGAGPRRTGGVGRARGSRRGPGGTGAVVLLVL